jgi:hypothetical protein
MKVTYKKLLNSISAFRELQEMKLPPRTSLDIYKLGKEVDRELETYQEMAKKVYLEHGAKEDGESLSLKEIKDLDALTEDLKELQAAEADLKEVSIPVELFERFNLNVSTNMLIGLDWLIKFEEEEEEAKAATE